MSTDCTLSLQSFSFLHFIVQAIAVVTDFNINIDSRPICNTNINSNIGIDIIIPYRDISHVVAIFRISVAIK